MRNARRLRGMLVLRVPIARSIAAPSLVLASLLVAAAPAAGAPAWVGPLTPSSSGTDNDEPRVGIDGQGNAMAVWLESSGSSGRIMASERPAGGSFGTPFQISRDGVASSTPTLSV